MRLVGQDLGDDKPVEPLKMHEAYSFSARVSSDGQFAPDGPLASLPCRMYRVYGPHRFMRVHYEEPLPKHVRLGVISFAGRRWELLYADLAKRVLVYFAVKGVLIREIPVETVREWHIPFKTAPENLDMPLAKYNARFSLGFSESIATVTFDALQEVADIVAPGSSNVVMTDGCAAMPLWAMQQIATAAQLPVLPSVVQGRIGAAKGVWYLDPFATNPQVRPSQVKWKLPFPTLEQRRFELCEWSRDRGPASLNYQFVFVLLHLGVPMDVFVVLLREHAALLRQDLAFRPKRTSQALPLLQAGFAPETCPYLRRLLSNVAGANIGRLGERMRIPVNQSRWLLVVADPTGSLKFGQAFVHLSSSVTPLKGRVVMARNPCHLPSDVQVAECVAEPRLAHIRDALVLPVQGPYPFAQLLSGGDYDGDLVFVSWDTRLLPPAGCPERMPPPELPLNPEAKLDNVTRATTLADLNKKDISSAMVELFRNHTLSLGTLTQIHAAIAEKEGVASEAAVRTAWLCRDAVDSPKSGLRVRVPKPLAAYGTLGRDEVLMPIRTAAEEIRKSFVSNNGNGEDADAAKRSGSSALDPDLIIPEHTQWLSFAQTEYADWRHAMHVALEEGKGKDVKSVFRVRFSKVATPANRLALASAYYVACANSASQSFAFEICLRELIRLKADSCELRECGDIALSSISRFTSQPKTNSTIMEKD